MKPPGLDILRVYTTDDGKFLYFLIEFAGPPTNSSFLLLNTDRNRLTGCGKNMGFEFGITFSPDSPPEESYIGDARSCSWGNTDFPGALTYAINGNFIEASVPLEVLNSFGLVKEVEFFCNNDWCGSAKYTLKTPPPPRTPVGGATEGLYPFLFNQFVAICMNLSTGQQVIMFTPSPHWNCETMGLRISPGDLIVTGGAGIVPR